MAAAAECGETGRTPVQSALLYPIWASARRLQEALFEIPRGGRRGREGLGENLPIPLARANIRPSFLSSR